MNGLDYLSEYLYNKNPNHPERSDKWLYIFDTPMAVASLKQKQRAYFPFSRVWSRNFAAIKIQAFWKGFLVRKRDDVQEMRQFWKVLQNATVVTDLFTIILFIIDNTCIKK